MGLFTLCWNFVKKFVNLNFDDVIADKTVGTTEKLVRLFNF